MMPEQILSCSHETICQQNVERNHKRLDISCIRQTISGKTCAIGLPHTDMILHFSSH